MLINNSGKRNIIVHYHTYKNAGSTIDLILKTCFPGQWANFDLVGVPGYFIRQSDMEGIARSRPDIRAFSSHQMRLPVPKGNNVNFLPIIFIRHPILRASSIWRYEGRRKNNHPRSIFARENSFQDWVKKSFEPPHSRAIMNNQAYFLSFGPDRHAMRDDPKQLENAIANIEALPSIGVVSEFQKSILVYEKLYQPQVPGFAYHEVEARNATHKQALSIDEALEKAKEELGDLYGELERRNDHDLALYNLAKAKLDTWDIDIPEPTPEANFEASDDISLGKKIGVS